ncbi:siderophore-interacting protein [Pantoea sp. A4]|uniref:siderophore-interacting protein n=1 Tax=Pantoea sp. A4 TaxID=1225184 RepID=UPI000379D600|nr:siderophore-interacting protein [Pantoea sp. A4]
MAKKQNETVSRAPQRVRNELRFRHVTVASKEKIANAFWRVIFSGEDLAGFNSPSFEDHIKVFIPAEGSTELQLPTMTEEGIVWPDGVRPPARDYTPLAFDGESSLTLDFYIHEGGVASGWADRAQVGDKLAVGGPRGSLIIPADYAVQLYVLDESGLPAFKRRKDDLQAEQVHVFAYADEATGREYLGDLSGINVTWLGSGNMHSDNLGQLIAEISKVSIPTEEYFVWLTGEGEFVKTLSDYFTERCGLDSDYVRAVAYWHLKK